MNAIILSAQFWPPFKQETLQLPAEVTEALNVYTKSFEALKGNRTLVWKTNLGQVNLDLDIGEKHVNLNVTPVQAAIIYQFQVGILYYFYLWFINGLSTALFGAQVQ